MYPNVVPVKERGFFGVNPEARSEGLAPCQAAGPRGVCVVGGGGGLSKPEKQRERRRRLSLCPKDLWGRFGTLGARLGKKVES